MGKSANFTPGCGERIVDLLDRLGRTMRRLEFDGGLNPVHWETLRYLSRANHQSRTPTALAEYLGTTRGTASQTVNCLEGKGLVAKTPCNRDKRVTYLELTGSGRDLLVADPLIRIEHVLDDVPPELCHTLREGLRLLLNRMVSIEGGPEFGVCRRCNYLESGEAGDASPHRCGLTGEPLRQSDTACICVSFTCPDEARARARTAG